MKVKRRVLPRDGGTAAGRQLLDYDVVVARRTLVQVANCSRSIAVFASYYAAAQAAAHRADIASNTIREGPQRRPAILYLAKLYLTRAHADTAARASIQRTPCAKVRRALLFDATGTGFELSKDYSSLRSQVSKGTG